jgi:hypothetical protein
MPKYQTLSRSGTLRPWLGNNLKLVDFFASVGSSIAEQVPQVLVREDRGSNLSKPWAKEPKQVRRGATLAFGGSGTEGALERVAQFFDTISVCRRNRTNSRQSLLRNCAAQAG